MKSPLAKKIVFDFFDGKYTSIQRKMIEEWLTDQENRELYYKCLDEWESQHPQYIIDTESGFEKIYNNITNNTIESNYSTVGIKKLNFIRVMTWLVAASVVVACGWSGWLYFSKPSIISYEILVENTRNKTGEIYEKKNLTSKPMLVNLPDKSSVILQPQSKISYSPRQYNKTKREVLLSGEAFFEVQKNSDIPFFVYANNLITKVLGTSFSVNARPSAPETEVIVKTGRVAVFMQDDNHKDEKINGKSLAGVVLEANEKIKVNRKDHSLEKPEILNPEKLTMPIQRLEFNFDETPAVDVLEMLKVAYTIQIIYDKNKLATCKLTAHLSDEPLIEKIKLICIALDADYEEVDTKIIIKSNGCN